MTLGFIHENGRILLAMKKRSFGKGRWNGYGGKVLEGETIEQAMKREMNEESGIIANEIDKYGIITFEFKGNPELLEVHVFKVNSHSGEAVETEEMSPKWFSVDEIPYDEMWKDDKYWLPEFLKGKKFQAKFLFNDKDEVLEHKVELI